MAKQELIRHKTNPSCKSMTTVNKRLLRLFSNELKFVEPSAVLYFLSCWSEAWWKKKSKDFKSSPCFHISARSQAHLIPNDSGLITLISIETI